MLCKKRDGLKGEKVDTIESNTSIQVELEFFHKETNHLEVIHRLKIWYREQKVVL